MLSRDELNFLSRFFDAWNKLVVFERNRREWEELAEEEEAEEHYEFVPIDISLFKKEDNIFKLNYNGVLYVIDPYDEEIDQYVSTWQIKAYSESNQLIFGMESESDSESESEPETEESIKLQIARLDIEIEAKIKLRDYLKSKI
jgi:hypothetical protein